MTSSSLSSSTSSSQSQSPFNVKNEFKKYLELTTYPHAGTEDQKILSFMDTCTGRTATGAFFGAGK
jgi:hypothetical protein